LLPIAGTALAVAVTFADAVLGFITALRRAPNRRLVGQSGRVVLSAVATSLLLAAMVATTVIQYKSYLSVPPEELTKRYKGGQQWVVLRAMGREIARRTAGWDQPHLYIWGWQSPLLFYSRLDSPTRHLFVDNLLRDQADRNHALIAPRTKEIIDVLEAHPPELIMSGYPPFRALRTFIEDRYRAAQIAPGLWLRRDVSNRFDSASP
jgi:hypothetical protein